MGLDGGTQIRKDIFDTNDGMAKYPYVRESARIKAVTTILEQDCGLENRSNFLGVSKDNVRPEHYHDSVGIGHYQIDLHPHQKVTTTLISQLYPSSYH